MISEQLLNEFIPAVYRSTDGETLPYRLLKPLRYNERERYPLLLFLHGSDEKGTDNIHQIAERVAVLASPGNREKFPAFLVVPQCPRLRWWTEPRILPLLFKICERVQRHYPVDAARRYITGYSTGAFGVWKAIEQDPAYFAAAVPVAGGGDIGKVSRLTRVPIWAFHGARDQVINAKFSREMIDAVRAAGGTPQYTEYPNGGHDIWRFAYRSEKLFTWMFQQRAGKK